MVSDETKFDAGQVLDLLIRGGNCVVWSAVVAAPTKTAPQFTWHFHEDYVSELPNWFNIQRRPNENLSTGLSRARVEEDDARCNRNSQRALIMGWPGYKQSFRITLINGDISWVDETVAIRKIDDTRWHIVGLCTSAEVRRQLEERTQVLSEEVKASQAERDTQEVELNKLRERLSKEKAHYGERE